MPYPPSLSNTAAKIIDPLTGASTWAFGSHKWTKNIGSFTKKAPIHTQNKIKFNAPDSKGIMGLTIKKNKNLPLSLLNFKIKNKRGREENNVYIKKYKVAWIRSIWYPHPRIKNIVGIKENSKKK